MDEKQQKYYQDLGKSLQRQLYYVKLLKYEHDYFKGMAKNAAVNHLFAKGINMYNYIINGLSALAKSNTQKKTILDDMESDRVHCVANIIGALNQMELSVVQEVEDVIIAKLKEAQNGIGI